ncbi:hypothetical protein PV721_13800 [Streptomyces sp. MB09-01]|uniref:hypothetical protein n=1 Tax=Streptomyces sp. MB09-01 TaxID=3028666 RepID=UPI0029B706FC|nr:hypothetical protein [Streptomyces sp. MB09-01]MDX3535424.1 hypothetical protein [Streptomyces sp. MB09-01]
MDATDEVRGVGPGEVEVYYRPRPGDAREALRWRIRKTFRGRLWLLLWLGLPLVPAALAAARGIPEEQTAVLAVLVPAVGWYGAYLSLDWRAHRMYKEAARYPEYRCTLSDTGVVTRLPDGTSGQVSWDWCAGFGETRKLFVLLVKENGAVLWLPKRAALTDAELDRVRAFHARNLRRL